MYDGQKKGCLQENRIILALNFSLKFTTVVPQCYFLGAFSVLQNLNRNLKNSKNSPSCRTIFLGRSTHLNGVFEDEWIVNRDEIDGTIMRAAVFTNLRLNWDCLEMMLCASTAVDFVKIYNKLYNFFQEQIKSSRIVWNVQVSRVSVLKIQKPVVKFFCKDSTAVNPLLRIQNRALVGGSLQKV